VAGLTLSLIFILPHAVCEPEFPVPDPEAGGIAWPRAVRQVRVTIDIMRHRSVVTWLVGGLNFHREHHLFPGISRAHYKSIAPIVDAVCGQFGIRHIEHRTYLIGLRSHYR
jgi:linoleoyl-CoA desaturase